jgi:hypothetical protein
MPDKTAFRLSVLIAFLAACASLGGLALPHLYRDNAFVRTAWLGNDAVTLAIGVPLLGAALLYVRRGSLRAGLLWLGMLDYMLYNYAFYLFAAGFNAFFLIYTAVFGLSIFALIFGLARLEPHLFHERATNDTPFRWVAGYFLFVGIGLTIVYVVQSLGFVATGQLPAIVVRSGHPTSIVFALDLTLLVPWLLLAGVWLLQRRPWGYVIAGIVSTKAALYTLVLTVNTWLVGQAGLGGADELPLWATLTVLGLVACALLFSGIPERKALLAAGRPES